MCQIANDKQPGTHQQRQSVSGRLKRLISLLAYYYLFAIGLSSVRFDFERHRVIRSRAREAYAAVLNVALLASMPFALRASFAYLSQLSAHQLLLCSDRINIVIHFLVITLLIVMRRRRERCFERTAREFYAIDELHFDRLPRRAALERYFDVAYVAKFFTTVCQMAVNIFVTLELTPQLDAQAFLLALYMPNLLNFLHGVMFHYFATLWLGCQRFARLNMQLRQLQQLLTHPAADECLLRAATAELRAIAQVHWRLSRLLLSVSDGYRCPILGVLLTFLLHYIVLGYYAVLACGDSLPVAYSRSSLLLGLCAYALMLADMYLIYRMCEATTLTYQRTSDILKELPALPCGCVAFEREYEAFCLQLLQSKLRINIGGFFDLNRKTLLAFWAFIMRHIIILLQYDFEHRLRQQHAAGEVR